MTTPGYVYLCAGGDTASLVIVELSLLESVPSGWFAHTFGRTGRTARPAPLPEPFRGLPVYGVPTTADILREIVFLLRFPQRLAKAKNKVPLALEATVDLDLWKLSLEYFGFNEWNVVEADDEEETKRAAKRARHEETVSAARIAFLQEFSAQLGAQIREKHSNWADFASGINPILSCTYDCPWTPSHDDPCTMVVNRAPVRIAAVLHAIRYAEVELVEQGLLQALRPAKTIERRITRDGKSTTTIKITGWPSGEKTLAKDEEHIVVCLTFSHSAKVDKS